MILKMLRSLGLRRWRNRGRGNTIDFINSGSGGGPGSVRFCRKTQCTSAFFAGFEHGGSGGGLGLSWWLIWSGGNEDGVNIVRQKAW